MGFDQKKKKSLPTDPIILRHATGLSIPDHPNNHFFCNLNFQDYLARLEAIRRQNYAERCEVQKRMAGIRGPPEAIPSKVCSHLSP
jgi:hypothetical protein